MLWSAYAPLGISWFIVLADDSTAARTALTGAIGMAGLGPMALLWVGWATFMMSAKSAGALLFTNIGLAIFSIVYPIMNILLIVMHYHLSPPMYAWLATAPMYDNPIDSATPWNKPSERVAVAPIVIAPIEIAPIVVDPIEVDPIEVEVAPVEVSVSAEVEVEETADDGFL